MAMISGILGLVGGLVSAAGASATGNYEAQVARNNEIIANQNAQYAREAGMQAATNQSRAGAAKEAAVVGGLAASGVDINTGSAVDVIAGQRETNKLDTETVENKAELTAYGYTTQAVNYEAQARQDELSGQVGATSGLISGIGSLAGSASSLPFNWGGGGGAASPTTPAMSESFDATSGGAIPSYGQMPGTGWPA
jgi:hypothetical protein